MSNKLPFSWELYHQTPIVGIIRGLSLDVIRPLAEVYLEAGFYTLEVTMNTAGADEIITTIKAEYPELNVGAGTVCNLDDLNLALAAGSQFIVTPVLDKEVVGTSVARGIPIFPGAYTPTEIYQAWTLGASAVKVFPASQLGPRYIKEVLAPLNDIKLLPTGGVTLENIESFFEAGAAGVGMGGSLFNKELVKNRNFNAIKAHFAELKSKISRV